MAKKLLGSGSKGRTGNSKFRGSRTVPAGMGDPTNPSSMAAPDVVQDRKNRATAGTMLSKQLRKNKSMGLRKG
jgi:hypothetical protein